MAMSLLADKKLKTYGELLKLTEYKDYHKMIIGLVLGVF
jgi:hypothetical protein